MPLRHSNVPTIFRHPRPENVIEPLFVRLSGRTLTVINNIVRTHNVRRDKDIGGRMVRVSLWIEHKKLLSLVFSHISKPNAFGVIAKGA